MSKKSNNARKQPLDEPSRIEILQPEKKVPVSRGGKRGRKPSSYSPAAPRRRRKLAPGRGAEGLVNSVNTAVFDNSDRIARALVDRTIAGDIKSAHLLVELSGVKHPPAKSEREPDQPSLAEMLLSSGEWVDDEEWKRKLGSEEWNSRAGSEQWNKPLTTEEWNQNPPLPGESLHDFHERRLRFLPPPKPEP